MQSVVRNAGFGGGLGVDLGFAASHLCTLGPVTSLAPGSSHGKGTEPVLLRRAVTEAQSRDAIRPVAQGRGIMVVVPSSKREVREGDKLLLAGSALPTPLLWVRCWAHSSRVCGKVKILRDATVSEVMTLFLRGKWGHQPRALTPFSGGQDARCLSTGRQA